MSLTFSRDELFLAIERAAATRAPEETPNSVTLREYAEAAGVPRGRAVEELRAAVNAGVMRAERIWRRMLHGHMQRVMGYVIVERGEAS